MDYLFSFLCALGAFISPCILPMLPVFVSYFTAGESNKKRTFINSLGFALGVIIVTVAIGALFAAIGVGLGSALNDYSWLVNIIAGSIIVLLGLNFIGLIKIPFLNNTINVNTKTENMRFFSALLFGLIFALTFGPCSAAFQSFNMSQAITIAIETGSMFKGIMLQLVYSVTLGLLFVICAMLIDQLKGVFGFIKRHYRVINIISGAILIVLGILVATGVMAKLANVMV